MPRQLTSTLKEGDESTSLVRV